MATFLETLEKGLKLDCFNYLPWDEKWWKSVQ